MTPINNFDDILSAMEQDPALREALRNHVLGEEFMQLPAIARRQEELITLVINRQMELASTLRNLAEQISGYALASSRVITTTVERQDHMEADIAELKAGQAQLAASVQELLESQSRTETNIAELKAGQDRMDSRQDRMDSRQDRMEGDITELKAGQTRRRFSVRGLVVLARFGCQSAKSLAPQNPGLQPGQPSPHPFQHTTTHFRRYDAATLPALAGSP